MPVMIQIRNVPDKVHRKLKARAAEKGLSLSEYLLQEVSKVAETPTLEEMLERLKKLEPVITDISPTQMIREERDRE